MSSSDPSPPAARSEPSNAAPDSNGVPVGQSDPITQAMKQLLVQCTSLGDAFDSTTQTTLSAEDKAFLEGALKSAVSKKKEAHVLESTIRSLESLCNESRECTEEELTLLENLEELTEDMHIGDDFINMGGLRLCERLIGSGDRNLIIPISNTIANISSNNPTIQTEKHRAAGHALLKQLLLSAKEPFSPSLKSKLLYAASSILSSNSGGVYFALTHPQLGLKYFFNLYTTNENVQVRRRLGRIIGTVFRDAEDPTTLSSEPTISFCQNLIENWWKEENVFVFVNLDILHSIFMGISQPIRIRIKEELGPHIQPLFLRMRALQLSKDAELAVVRDEEEGLSTLDVFERELNAGPQTASPGISTGALQLRLA